MPRWTLAILLFAVLGSASGCAPMVVGGGAVEGYKLATDERPIGRQIDDGTISAGIKLRFINTPDIPARMIDVDVVNGNVILTGAVPTREQADLAIEIARNAEGVRRVTDNLQIGAKTFRQSFDDSILANKVKAKLVTEPGIQSMQIDVDVVKGVITLSGVVGSSDHKQRIIDISRTTPGAVKVIDNLTVKR